MIKKIFFGLLSLIIILILGIVIFLLTFDLNHYRHFVETQASNALGYTVKINSMSTKLSLIPTINVEGVTISDTNQKEPILNLPKLEAVIELTSLIQGNIVVPKINVPSASLVWTGEATKKEKNNSTQNQQKTKQKSKAQIWIEEIDIGTLQCKIGKEKVYEFNLNNIALNELSKISFDVVYQKNTITVNANFGSILELASKKENLPIDLTLKQGRSNLKINGKIGDVENLKKINFQITGNIPNLSSFLKNWGIKNSKIPTQNLSFKTAFEGDLEKINLSKTSLTIGKSDLVLNTQGTLTNLKENLKAVLDTSLSLNSESLEKIWGVKPFESTCKIIGDKKTIQFSEFQLNAGKSDVKGQITVYFETKPILIKGTLSSTYFDIKDILGTAKTNTAKTENKNSSPKKKILSTDKLPFDLLSKLNTDIQLAVSNLKISDKFSEYMTVNTNIVVKNDELKMPAQIRVLGGKIQNQLNIAGNKKTLQLETKIEGIQLNKIKQLNNDIQNSSLNLSLSIKTTGESLHDLASSANGNWSAELTQGQIVNSWFNTLPTTLNLLKGKTSALSFSTQDQKTELICGAVNMPIKNGILTSKNQIALETDTLSFIVNGQVDLKNETLNLTMVPSVNQTRGMANELLNATQSIHLTGPWTEIKTSVDSGAALENLAQTAIKKLAGNEQLNQGTQATSLCQKALGRPLMNSPKTTKTTVKKEIKSQPQQTQPKQDLKQQLIQSLSQALTDKVVNKKK